MTEKEENAVPAALYGLRSGISEGTQGGEAADPFDQRFHRRPGRVPASSFLRSFLEK